MLRAVMTLGRTGANVSTAVMMAAMATAACGKGGGKASPGDCEKACEHILTLAHADLEKSLQVIDDPAMSKALRDQAVKSRTSDKATCVRKCGSGELDTACALQAKTLDGVMSCGGRGTGRKPVDPPAERTDAEWPKATLREVRDTVGGVAFTVRLPAELQEQEADRTDEQRGWDFPGQPFSQPRFRVSTIEAFPKTLDDGLAYYDPDDDETVLRKEHTGDRFVLLYKSKTYVVADVVIPAGDKALECYGTHSGHYLTQPDLIGPWLVDVCTTLALAK